MVDYAYIGPCTGDREAVIATLTEQHWPEIAVDTEAITVKNQTIIGIGLMYGPHRLYVRTFPELTDAVPIVMHLISRPDITKIYHNCFYDLRALTELADEEGFVEPDVSNLIDTSFMAKVSGRSAALEDNSRELLNFSNEYSIKELLAEAGRGATMLDVPFEKVAKKCLNDVWATYNLASAFNLTPAQRDCYEVDIKMARLLLHMEGKGLLLDQPKLSETRERLKRSVVQLADICSAEGFNPGSPQQVGYVLASRGNILPFTKSRRSLRTDDETLSDCDDPLAQTVLDYRKATKLLGTYVEPWIGKERASTHFRMDLSTGRIASFDRNLQNIPPDMRGIFLPDDMVWSWFDYSQIELRCLAAIAGDSTMTMAYANGQDLHQMTADAAGVSRQDAKTFNFAKVYGASDRMLARRTTVPKERIRELRAAWDKLYPDAAYWINSRMRTHGDTVETYYGRKMLLPQEKEGMNTGRGFEIHVANCAVNYSVQGTAADIMKRAMLHLDDSPDFRLQIHDEALVNGYYDFNNRGLESICPDIPTPIEAKFGPLWIKG